MPYRERNPDKLLFTLEYPRQDIWRWLVAGDSVKTECDERVAQRRNEPARLAPVQQHEREPDMFVRLHNKMYIAYMETNVIQKLQQDEETALDALGELAQKDSTEATIAEYAMINNSVLYKEFLAERQEILCHKWIESEKAGDDIGFERALLDWVVKYRSTWREKRHRS